MQGLISLFYSLFAVIVPLTSNCGKNVIAGTEARLYLIPAGELTNHPQTKEELGGSNPGDDMILDQPYTYVATSGLGYWREYTIIVDSGEVVDTLIGEVGFRGWENTLAFQIQGTEVEQLQFARDVANGCLVAMVTDRQGITRVFGKYNDPCFVDAIEIRSGKKPGDVVGGTYLLKNSAGGPALTYDLTTHGINTTPNV